MSLKSTKHIKNPSSNVLMSSSEVDSTIEDYEDSRQELKTIGHNLVCILLII
jgi:hypothetical protein